MGIGWVNADGKAGYSENEYDYTMQSMDDFRHTDQQRLEGSFQALGIAEPVQKPAPIQGEGYQVPAPEAPGQAPPIAEPRYTPGQTGDAPEAAAPTGDTDVRTMQTAIPDFSKWPTDIDVGISRGNDLSYGDKSAPYINYTGWDKNAAPKMKSLTIADVAKVFNGGKGDYATGQKEAPISPEQSEQIHEAWLVARRSPLAYLGFDLAKTSSTPPTNERVVVGNSDIRGLTNLNTLESWYRRDSKTTLLHESIHRGYEKVLDSNEFNDWISKNPSYKYPQEDVTRALMIRHAGFVEASTGTSDQLLRGLAVPARYLDKIEEIASKLVAKPGKTHAEIDSMTHSKVATNEPNPVAEGLKNFGKEVLWPPVRDMLVDTLQSVAAGVPPIPGMRVPRLPKAPSLPKNSAAKDIPFPKDPTPGQLEIYNKRVAGSLLDEGTSLKAVNKATGIDETELKFMRDKRSLAASSIWGETPLHDLYRQRLGIDVNRPIKPSELKDFTMGLNSEEIGAVVKNMPPNAVADFERQLARNTLLNKGSSKKEIMDFMFPKKVPENKRTLMNRIEETVGPAATKTKEGIFTGEIHAISWEKAGSPRESDYTQGFITSTGRFVDRHEALEIARRKKQITSESNKGQGMAPDIGLLSEDLK